MAIILGRARVHIGIQQFLGANMTQGCILPSSFSSSTTPESAVHPADCDQMAWTAWRLASTPDRRPAYSWVFGPPNARCVPRTHIIHLDSLSPQGHVLGKKTLHGTDAAEGAAAVGRRRQALSRSRGVDAQEAGGSDVFERQHDNHPYDKPPGNGNAADQPNERGATRGGTGWSCDERRGARRQAERHLTERDEGHDERWKSDEWQRPRRRAEVG